MRWSAGRFVWAVLGLWLGACGGVSQKDFPSAYSEAVCHFRARCGVIRDEGACLRRVRAPLEADRALGEVSYPYSRPLGGSLRAGRLRFDENRAAQCVTRLRGLSCESGLDEASVFEACNPYVGELRAKQACLLDMECVPGLYCERAEEGAVCATGTCVPSAGRGERPREGQPCARDLTLDAEGLCQSFLGEGDACSESRGCDDGLFCDARTSTCRPQGREGQACVPEVAPCLFRLNCGDEGRCQRRANLGESCTSRAFVVRGPKDAPTPATLNCKDDLACEGATRTTRGVCGEPHAAGGTCDSAWDCQHPLACPYVYNGGATCEAFGKIGAPCGRVGCAEGAWCDAGTGLCAAQGLKRGDTCDSSSPEASRYSCVPGFACEDGRCAPAYGGTCEK